MMLMRAMIRANTLPACVNRNLTKNLNTKADAANCSESKPKTFQDSSHQNDSEHPKLSTDEIVSCYCRIASRLAFYF